MVARPIEREYPMMNGSQVVYLTVREVAERWGVTTRTVKTRINQGLLKAIRVSTRGDLRISLSELERYELENQKIPNSNP